MSIKASSILRSAALLGITVAAWAMLTSATMAQAPRPDFPGAKQQDQSEISHHYHHYRHHHRSY